MRVRRFAGVCLKMTLDLKHFRALLLQRREALQQVTEAGDEAAKPVELDQTRVGRLSRMDALQAQAMSKETQRRRGQELNGIQQALQRLESETYGECLDCGEMIATGRLEVDPAARLCIKCAEKSA